ncbi:hypothetical protein ABZ614_20080, partial [Streptomyces sp. NPDC013178]
PRPSSPPSIPAAAWAVRSYARRPRPRWLRTGRPVPAAHVFLGAAGAGPGDAIAAVLAKSDVRTRDLGGTATTDEFTEKLLELL